MSLVAMSTTLGAATAPEAAATTPLGAATEVDITKDIETSP